MRAFGRVSAVELRDGVPLVVFARRKQGGGKTERIGNVVAQQVMPKLARPSVELVEKVCIEQVPVLAPGEYGCWKQFGLELSCSSYPSE